jgi:hypothetical protein
VGKLDPLIRRQRAAATGALTTFANHVLGEAQRIAPLEEGTLAASGTVDVQHTPGGAEATISFSTPYAARQHEELAWQHRAGRQAKYLETPFKRELRRLGPLVKAAIDRVS